MVHPRHFPAESAVDPRLTLLTGADWSRFMRRSLREAQRSVRFSLFIFSSRWRSLPSYAVNLLDECIATAERGVDCRIVLGDVDKKAMSSKANLRTVQMLSDAGWLVRVSQQRMLHDKVYLFDDRISVIGSHNISQGSLMRNYETSVAIVCPEFARQVRALWWQRWGDGVSGLAAVEAVLKHGAWRNSRSAPRTGTAVLQAAGITRK